MFAFEFLSAHELSNVITQSEMKAGSLRKAFTNHRGIPSASLCSVEWLQRQITQPKLCVLDCTWLLPNSPFASVRE